MESIENTTKLLKLHLRWPERKQFSGKEDEPIEFYKWLFVNHHDRPEVMELEDVELVGEFLIEYKHVLWPSPKQEEKMANLRLEPRIENDVNVEITVMESSDPSLIKKTVAGRTLDLGLHGMRVTTELKIPVGSKLKLVVAKVPTSGNSYHLFGELRWNSDLAAGFLFGIKLEETEEFEIWREAFGAEFVAPVLGRSKD